MSLAHVWKVFGERITQGPTLAFFVLMLALVLAPRLAEKARLPAMMGLVLAGMILGPHGLRVLDADKISLSALGTFGLLYLMFSAGLELDFKRLMANKRQAITFALLSFVIPFSWGIASARVLHYAWAAAMLMGSNWGSHTLVTYPMLRKAGLARNRAVGTVVGATSITDTTALLVLSAVSVSVKKSGSLEVQAAEIVLGLVILVVYALWLLPKIARWFFSHVGSDRSLRLVFGLAAFCSCAVLAEMASIDGIVGAFLAGLGLNRVIPARSPLMEQVQFVGAALFIPIFLVSVGILLDPKVLVQPATLLIALVFTVTVLGGKALAAVIAGRTFHFTWAEVGVMAGLSGSQAAATLATTLVGARLGIFDKTTINAVLVVILISLVVTPAMVSYCAARVPKESREGEALGSAVLVPVWGESTRPVLALAGQLAAPDGGIVIAAGLATELAAESELAARRSLMSKAQEWLAKEGLESQSVFRLSSSIPEGLLQTVRSEGATLLVAEWQASEAGIFEADGAAFRSLRRAAIPVVLVHGALGSFDRIVLVGGGSNGDGDGEPCDSIARHLVTRLAHHRRVVWVASPKTPKSPAVANGATIQQVESDDPLGWLADHAGAQDLLIFRGLAALREALARGFQPDVRPFMIAIAPEGDVPQPHPEATDAFVAGRSLVERPAR